MLGAVAATAGPAIASLTGDYFPANERGRVWSYILVGEAAGRRSASSSAASWPARSTGEAAFVVLSIPGFFVARELWRTVPEPLRGGQSHLEVGTMDLEAALSQADGNGPNGVKPSRAGGVRGNRGDQRRPVKPPNGRVPLPNPALVLHEDPSQMGLWRSVRYLFEIPSNR